MSLTVIGVYPQEGEEGLPLLTPITVEFSEPVDIDSINVGSFVVSSLAKNVIMTGPVIHDWASLRPDELLSGNLLESPSFNGTVVGTYSFSADLKTVTFRPTQPLSTNTNHVTLLSPGILTRTIGPIGQGSYGPVQGTGMIELIGPYTGVSDDSITIQIQSTGSLGGATFIYWFGSDPFTVSAAITLDRSIRLEAGLIVKFAEGNYVAGDTFFAQLYVGTPLESLYSWQFSTGDGALVTPPIDEKSTSLIDATVTEYNTGEEVVTIEKITYLGFMEGGDVPITVREFSIQFSTDLDPDSVTDETVVVYLSTIGSYNTRPSTPVELDTTLVTDGDTITITIDADAEIEENMELVFMFNGVKDSNGNSIARLLETLTTRLNPFYTTIDRIRLEIGPFIDDVPDDTIARLIYNFSSAVDALNFGHVLMTDEWYAYIASNYVVCKVILTLMDAVVSGTGGKRDKTLGDLKVGYDQSGGLSPKSVRDKANRCADTLLPALKNSGLQYLQPMNAIKGKYALNRPRFGRSWLATDPESGIPIGNVKEVIFNRAYTTGSTTRTITESNIINTDENE